MPSLVGKNTFPFFSSLIGRVVSTFRRKMCRLYPSETDIEMFIPAPTKQILLRTKNQKISDN